MRWLLFAFVMLIGPVQAGDFFWRPNQFYQPPIVTEDQVRSACEPDVRRLCPAELLIGPYAIRRCMTAKRSLIGPACSTVLKAIGR
jgi:hypothetical protein